VRALPLRLHRWAGLATALFLIVAGLTGGALAFMDELEALINPGLFVAEPPRGTAAHDFADPFVLRERVQQLYPNARADHFTFPQAGKSQMFHLMPRLDPQTGQPYPQGHDQVFLNPYSGEVLGARKWGELFHDGRLQRENVVPFIWRLHEALALPHPYGKVFMGVVALVWTIDCFVGLLLTFPRRKPILKKWQIAWQIKRRASRARLNFDLHRAGALWLWLALLVFAWSSVMLNLRELAYQPLMSLAFEFEADRPPRLPAPELSPRLDWRAARHHARQALEAMARADGFAIGAEDSLWYRPALGAYLYRTRTSLDLRNDRGASDVWVDGDTGAVLKTRFESRGASGDVVSAWLRVLHIGHIGGLGYRSAVAVIGVAVAVLSITGVVIWTKKRAARRMARERAARAVERGQHGERQAV
jgi:uncharacterized iron-regulated membrane protein